MLEFFNELQRAHGNKALTILRTETKRHPSLVALLKLYLTDDNRIITPRTILKMMCYYRVQRHDNIDKICEIGEFAASRIMLLKRKEFGWSRNINTLVINMSNAKFLVDTYKKLRIEVQHKNQYEILKNCFILLSEEDIKWFCRLICKKIKIIPEFAKVIRENDFI